MTDAVRRARAATALAFATQGLVFISLTTRLPRFSDRWDLSEVELSLILLMIVLLAGVGSVVAELVARRSNSGSTLRAGLLTIALAVPLAAAAPAGAVFVAALAMYGVGLGIVDATSNMQAVAVEHRYGRPILPSFHGAWTFGGIIGASYALAAAHLPLWTAGLVAVVPFVALAAPYLPREHGEALAAAEQVAVPWRPIMLVGLGMVLFYMVDTAAQTWGPTYLDKTVDAPRSLERRAQDLFCERGVALGANHHVFHGCRPHRERAGNSQRLRVDTLRPYRGAAAHGFASCC